MTFARKLSYEEQEALTDQEFAAYTDWLFGHNEPITQRWLAREAKEREHQFQRECRLDARDEATEIAR